jgi:hypothetical protein
MDIFMKYGLCREETVGSSSPLSAMGQGKRWKGLGRLHPYTKLMNYGSSVLFTMFNSPMPDELLKIF